MHLVFKPKGADRKHKTDREKMSKRNAAEQEKFQPSYECTVFTEYPLEHLYATNTCQSPQADGNDSVKAVTPTPTFSPCAMIKKHLTEENEHQVVKDDRDDSSSDNQIASSSAMFKSIGPVALRADSTSPEVTAWLAANRLDSFARTFSNFSGADLLRLTRDEAIEICGLADGIRFYNALHARTIRPRLTLYVGKKNDDLHRAIYLDSLSVIELAAKLSAFVPNAHVSSVCLLGPSGIKVLVTDEVVQNLPQESMFLAEFDKGNALWLIALS